MNTLLSNISVKAKIVFSNILILLLVGWLGSYGYTSLSTVGGHVGKIASKNGLSMNVTAALTGYQMDQAVTYERALRNAVLMGQSAEARKTYYTEKDRFQSLSDMMSDEAGKAANVVGQAIAMNTQNGTPTHQLGVLKTQLEKLDMVSASYSDAALEALNSYDGGSAASRQKLMNVAEAKRAAVVKQRKVAKA